MALTTINHQLSTTQAQQISQYTQYVFNHYSVQPAVAGSKDCFDGRLGFRRQWGGIQGMPVTAWATIHGALRSKKPFVKNKHGFGVNIEADDTGPIGYPHFYLGWAYHMQMGQDYMLSMGLFAGLKQFKLDLGEVTLDNPNDPAVTGNKSVMVWPEIAPGIWAYGKNFWLGASMFGTFNNPITWRWHRQPLHAPLLVERRLPLSHRQEDGLHPEHIVEDQSRFAHGHGHQRANGMGEESGGGRELPQRGCLRRHGAHQLHEVLLARIQLRHHHQLVAPRQ
ncbi:MAG: type IX secretion system membrane protein PorP/SprF [Flavobacteriales bacterium]|nr:type IX secretion system membrane protein PorP/SprF [Flavobacteriales bacterium]